MISYYRNVSRNWKILGRETVWGQIPEICFDNYINNQCWNLIKRADIYGIHFQGNGATIKYIPLLDTLSGRVCLPVSVQNIMDCRCHTTGDHNKVANVFADSFFDPMNDLDPEKKLVDLHLFDGASVCRKEKHSIEGCLSYSVMYCWSIA